MKKKEKKHYFLRNFFNWTWTYRLDSDIKDQFGPIYAKTGNVSPNIQFQESGTPKGANVDM